MWFFKKEKPQVQTRKNVSIRLEAIGGQGANSAGKILAEAAVLKQAYTGNHFSSFGSEKRGTPVRSFVRFSVEKKPVRSAAFIKNPDILVIFHESLIQSHQEILDGVTPQTDIIINSKKSPSEILFPQGFEALRVSTLPATEIASKIGCGLNAVMLGAISVYVPEIESESINDVLKSFFKKSPAEVQNKNLQGFQTGHDKLKFGFFHREQSTTSIQTKQLPDLGWMNAPLGGVITNPGNSVLKDHSSSRKGTLPKFYKDVCFNCGYCDMVCPDYCFIWSKNKSTQNPELMGIDYQYCKACQKCIEVCPVQALKLESEDNLTQEEKQLHLFKK